MNDRCQSLALYTSWRLNLFELIEGQETFTSPGFQPCQWWKANKKTPVPNSHKNIKKASLSWTGVVKFQNQKFAMTIIVILIIIVLEGTPGTIIEIVIEMSITYSASFR